ncbi:hypothetical protein P692DRAFT_20879759 [Suillus brevipes Sb2]|nr:hypothetical protein P692DRAFT_20879759 [Suillus brevipes Sb2]
MSHTLPVQFWLRSNYDTWLDSAIVSCIKRGTAPYLEEEDGTCITNVTLKSIRHRCHAAWAELVVKKLVLPTWARLCASGQTMMQSVMETEFPVFRLDMDGWKLTLLCTTDYPNWRKCHLDQDGSWKNPDKTAAKHKAMGDDNEQFLRAQTPVKMLKDAARFYEEWKKLMCAMMDQTDNKNGTTDEFKLYWNTLVMAQQDEYQAEAERLDSAGAWKKASDSAGVNGALH